MPPVRSRQSNCPAGSRQYALLTFRQMLSYIFVQSHLANFNQGEVLVGPDLGDIKKSATVRLSLLGLHYLHIKLPSWKLSPRDGIPQVLGVEVGICPSHPCGLLFREMGDTLSRPEVEFTVPEPATSCYHLEGMHTKTGHSPDRIRDTARSKQVHQRVDTLWLVDMEVPELEG